MRLPLFPSIWRPSRPPTKALRKQPSPPPVPSNGIFLTAPLVLDGVSLGLSFLKSAVCNSLLTAPYSCSLIFLRIETSSGAQVKLIQVQNDHDRYVSAERCPDDPGRPGVKLLVQDPAGYSDLQVSTWVEHLRVSLGKDPEDLLPTDFTWRGASLKSAPPTLGAPITASGPQFPKASGSGAVPKPAKSTKSAKGTKVSQAALPTKEAAKVPAVAKKKLPAKQAISVEADASLHVDSQGKRSQPKPKPVWEKRSKEAVPGASNSAKQKATRTKRPDLLEPVSSSNSEGEDVDGLVLSDTENHAAAYEEEGVEEEAHLPIKELVCLSHPLLAPTRPAWRPRLVSGLPSLSGPLLRSAWDCVQTV